MLKAEVFDIYGGTGTPYGTLVSTIEVYRNADLVSYSQK